MALTVTDARLDGAPVAVRCIDGTIAALGPDVAPEPGDELLDAAGMALCPGLVNGHTHAAMTLLRGVGDDLPLMEWLRTRIWPAEARLNADDVYWGTRLAAVEMLRSGTLHFVDMYWHAPAAARAAADVGIRATIAGVLIDTGAGVESRRDDARRTLAEVAGVDARVRPCLGPHAIYTVGPDDLRWVAETAAEHDVPVHIHLSETRREVEDCIDAHGMRPVPYLDSLGLLGPSTLLAHGCWFEPHELALVAERGATVVTNPVSNMKLATGRAFPYLDALDHGVALGLGTDGAASNNSLDLFQDMKVLSLLQKHLADDPAVLPAPEVFALASGQRSEMLGGTPVAVGARADFLLVDTDSPELVTGDLVANLVYAATGHCVDTAVVDGEVVMRHRDVADHHQILAECRARAARLVEAER
jgi:5-methylthioadenosine/S-adenosylhomocysteine deaminase